MAVQARHRSGLTHSPTGQGQIAAHGGPRLRRPLTSPRVREKKCARIASAVELSNSAADLRLRRGGGPSDPHSWREARFFTQSGPEKTLVRAVSQTRFRRSEPLEKLSSR